MWVFTDRQLAVSIQIKWLKLHSSHVSSTLFSNTLIDILKKVGQKGCNIRFGASLFPLSNSENHNSRSCFYQREVAPKIRFALIFSVVDSCAIYVYFYDSKGNGSWIALGKT